MAKLTASGIDIRGISTCVPGRAIGMDDGSTEEEVSRIIESAGTLNRHLARDDVCTSDLCERAAGRLLESLDWAPESIELLILVTHTPDYFMPATACVLQHKLGLSDRCAAFDMALGCTGYVYGLCLASRMLGSGGISRALVLVGETPSKLCDSSDRSTSLIFGDAGSATALEASESPAKSTFLLHSDGAGKDDFLVKAGAFRDRFNVDRREHYMRMNGAAIFVFTVKRVPPLIRESLEYAGLSAEQIDYFVFHQANKFMLDHLREKTGVERGKVPMNIEKFSNTAGTSLPLCITQGGLTRPPERPLQLLLLGYGVGLSWGSAAVQLRPDVVLCHTELD